MNLLKTLFTVSLTEPDDSTASSLTLPGTLAIEPLWTTLRENRAVVTDTIAADHLGKVKFQGTWWRAMSDRGLTLEPETAVRVIGRQRTNILIVEPLTMPVSLAAV